MSQKSDKDGISLVFVYSKDFMERLIRNLINDPCFLLLTLLTALFGLFLRRRRSASRLF
jgi:hypothetical protein